jgi:hypothetical protein
MVEGYDGDGNGSGETMSQRPDAIYWRRTMHHPDIEYADLENLWFWPGEGLCVDGYYYWIVGRRWKDRPRRFAKRIPREIWIQWGRKRHSPPTEKHQPDALQDKIEVFT